MKYYTFLQEGWFSKSDEEVGRENISRRTAREFCEDMKTFITIYKELYFVFVLLDGKYYETLINHLIKYHCKVKDIDKARYEDFDQAGKTIFSIILGIIDAEDSGVLDKIVDALNKHLDRFEPYECKRYYLNSGLDTMYRDLYDYLKQNKLNSFIKEIEGVVNRNSLIQSLQEALEDGILAAKEDGYDIRKTVIPKNIVKSHLKLPKLLVNTTPKNKIMKLKK